MDVSKGTNTMSKKVLITGSTDGIGLATAEKLAQEGHSVLLHGRNAEKLEMATKTILAQSPQAHVEGYLADLSHLEQVVGLARKIANDHDQIDALINNAGVFKTSRPADAEGRDVRMTVNVHAPYVLAHNLNGQLAGGRVVNVSSAAQAPVDVAELFAAPLGDDMQAYAKSKLAIVEWTRHLAHEAGDDGPLYVAVNPGSLLATNMVKTGFGVAGSDISIGVDILMRAALSEEFDGRQGAYFDNDSKAFADPHPAAMDNAHNAAVVAEMDARLAPYLAH